MLADTKVLWAVFADVPRHRQCIKVAPAFLAIRPDDLPCDSTEPMVETQCLLDRLAVRLFGLGGSEAEVKIAVIHVPGSLERVRYIDKVTKVNVTRGK